MISSRCFQHGMMPPPSGTGNGFAPVRAGLLCFYREIGNDDGCAAGATMGVP